VTLQVEWDEEKRLSNLERHRVDLRDAALIFEGPVIEAEDRRRPYAEIRHVALGVVGAASYVVVYTWRGETRRLISAWKVGKDGEK
jgi:uncharacterized protein